MILRILAGFMLWVFLQACSQGVQYNLKKSHHTKNGFKNLHTKEVDKGLMDLLKWTWEREKQDPIRFPLAENNAEFLRSNRKIPTLTWVGHSTFLIQFDSLNILTDPHFSKRASPVNWAGPQRYTPPGMEFDSLPPIDVVIISHNHYDHLDKPTIKMLDKRKQKNPPIFLVPLGLKKWFQDIGVQNVIEKDWWDHFPVENMKFTFVPAQHFSARTPFDKNKTLWGGWYMRNGNSSSSRSIYFVGDTGYSPHFKEIQEKMGSPDLSLIPIGAYEPRWFMKAQHVNPEESVQAHVDLQSKFSVGMHWGTFILTDEPMDDPPKKLQASLDEKGIEKNTFFVMKHGESLLLDSLWIEESKAKVSEIQ